MGKREEVCIGPSFAHYKLRIYFLIYSYSDNGTLLKDMLFDMDQDTNQSSRSPPGFVR